MVFLGFLNQFLSFLHCKIVLLQENILLSTFGQYFSSFKSCFQPFFPKKLDFLPKIPEKECKNFFFQNFQFWAINTFIIGVIYKKNQSLTSLFWPRVRDSSKPAKTKKSPRGSANSSLVCKFDQDRVFTTFHFVISIKFPFQWYITTPFTSWVKHKYDFRILLLD